ncbi:dTDP-4-dehydrorhamnose reductase [Ruegeria sediminis]|uniref:dTDP-4-dehydrorhamnose reductase n=1 Tax=Ruegeria sediminis TaxID=2583820 RepID=A0ABY2WZP1_9RHOB|nr:dTDP-4-dehydrorhamnose reductase [Ruegeria sediminis]TMV08450.1 dTDP-4-dehydrorhamnose reductase [Ruegeria sediminis]
MKVLLFGKTGQVSRELQRRAEAVTLEVVGRDQADFADPATCVEWIRNTDADAVINAAAYTAVDRAEDQEELAAAVNGTTPGALARAAAQRGLPFLHISTDYVFDGQGNTPYPENRSTAPLGAYGRSKLAGEVNVRAADGPHVILRTSWVVSSHGGNFVKTMLRLGAERDRLTIVADQIGGPTCAANIADTCLEVAKQLAENPKKTGTYHFSGGPDVSWADFAREIFRQSGIACEVVDIPSSDYPTPARRPLNSRLDNSKLESVFGIQRPNWRRGLSDILVDLGVLKS